MNGINTLKCKKCVIPYDYPGITIDEDGNCSYCKDIQPREYLGLDTLKNDLNELLKKYPTRKYDCVLGLSGGRDSTYLLHILKHKLNLNVLAFFIDHGLIPEHTRENVKKITSILGVKLIIKNHSSLTNCFPIQYKAWLKKPRVQTVTTLCMGCKSNIISNFYYHAKKYNAPLLMYGWTPYEGARYKMNLMRKNLTSKSSLSYVTGYFSEILKNPAIAMHPLSLVTQFNEFMFFYGPYKKILDKVLNTIEVKPFDKHIQWKEDKVVTSIKDMYNWKNFSNMKSSWRGDCLLGPIRQYIYKEILGFNDKTPHLSDLIRDKQLTREEALRRLPGEENTNIDIVKTCCTKLKIDYNELSTAINQAKETYLKESNCKN